MKASAKFIDQEQSDFFLVLSKKVNHYFRENHISRYGNREMIIKSVVLIAVYLGTYLAILFLSVNPWFLLPLALLMGVAMAGIGMSVMHDALHGSYSQIPQLIAGWVTSPILSGPILSSGKSNTTCFIIPIPMCTDWTRILRPRS